MKSAVISQNVKDLSSDSLSTGVSSMELLYLEIYDSCVLKSKDDFVFLSSRSYHTRFSR